MENFWTHIVHNCSPKHIETIKILSFQKIFQIAQLIAVFVQ